LCGLRPAGKVLDFSEIFYYKNTKTVENEWKKQTAHFTVCLFNGFFLSPLSIFSARLWRRKIMAICVCISRQGGGGGEQGKEMEEIPGIFRYFAQPIFRRLARRKEKVILPREMPHDGLPPPFSFNL
jgi:hypothetical protein